MRKSKFSEKRILGILREQETGQLIADVCRKHGVSAATFYKWKARFSVDGVPDAHRLKALEKENTKLKLLLAGNA